VPVYQPALLLLQLLTAENVKVFGRLHDDPSRRGATALAAALAAGALVSAGGLIVPADAAPQSRHGAKRKGKQEAKASTAKAAGMARMFRRPKT
jgi:hypothetical protein